MGPLTLDRRFKSDEIFNATNRHFITLKDKEMYEYNVHLKTVLAIFVEQMKKDPFFKACYRRIAYVGSYYEGLKVGKPEEFDLDVIINLPINYNDLTTIIASERPGYIKLQANSNVLPNLQKHCRWASDYKIMHSWFDKKNHLDQNKFRSWFESVVTKALSSFECVNGKYVIIGNGKRYLLSHKKSGPAWTMKIDVPQGHTVDIDLVPALEFTTPPPKPFINHRTTKQNWFAISKPLEGPNNSILWRPSFYEREQDILKGSIKPVIRQTKKLRDTQNFKSIASYYIKTLFLWELEKYGAEFEKLPSTFLFYHMLQRLQDACKEGKIYDYWNPKNNLLANIGSIEMKNISDRLNNIIKKIDNKIVDDKYVIAEFILTAPELYTLKELTLSNSMATLSLTHSNTAQPEAQNNNGFLSAIINVFSRWNSEPGTQ